MGLCRSWSGRCCAGPARAAAIRQVARRHPDVLGPGWRTKSLPHRHSRVAVRRPESRSGARYGRRAAGAAISRYRQLSLNEFLRANVLDDSGTLPAAPDRWRQSSMVAAVWVCFRHWPRKQAIHARVSTGSVCRAAIHATETDPFKQSDDRRDCSDRAAGAPQLSLAGSEPFSFSRVPAQRESGT